MTFAPDAMLVFDRGYEDHTWWLRLTQRKVHFVTRLKDSTEYGIVLRGQPRMADLLEVSAGPRNLGRFCGNGRVCER